MTPVIPMLGWASRLGSVVVAQQGGRCRVRCRCGGEYDAKASYLRQGCYATCPACSDRRRIVAPMRHSPCRIAAVLGLRGVMSARRIAEEMGMTKGQVVGIWFRASERERPIVRQYEPYDPFPPPGHCLWPAGDVRKGTLTFCGERAVLGRPYCAGHMAQAYRPDESEPAPAIVPDAAAD